MISQCYEFERTTPSFDCTKKSGVERKEIQHGQSPININRQSTVKQGLGKLTFPDLFRVDTRCKLENDGHSLKLYNGDNGFAFGGPLYGYYKFVQMHFHWSENDCTGTEHALEGRRYACESHFVFERDACHDSYTPARQRKRPPLCVVGVLFEVSGNAPHYRIFDFVPHLLEEHQHTLVEGNLLSDFAYALREDRYFNYSGSLTTPPYSEDVEWIVYQNVYPILLHQLKMLRQMRGHHGPIRNNVRDLQPIRSRQVLHVCNKQKRS